MTATCTLDDLEWLLGVVRSLPNRGRSPMPPDAAERVDRAESFLLTAIDTRLAQKRQKPTVHHAQLMDAYRAAVAKWIHDRELHSAGYTAEQREYAELHPRPTLKAFMLAHRHPTLNDTATCPLCGSLLEPAKEAA